MHTDNLFYYIFFSDSTVFREKNGFFTLTRRDRRPGQIWARLSGHIKTGALCPAAGSDAPAEKQERKCQSMKAAKKQRTERQSPPVVTGKDKRAVEGQRSVIPGKKDSDAPDGVSGNWS